MGLVITHSLPQTTAQLLTNTNTALGVSTEDTDQKLLKLKVNVKFQKTVYD